MRGENINKTRCKTDKPAKPVMPLQRPKADFIGLQKNAVVISA